MWAHSKRWENSFLRTALQLVFAISPAGAYKESMKISNSLAAMVLFAVLVGAGLFVYWKVNFEHGQQSVAEVAVSE